MDGWHSLLTASKIGGEVRKAETKDLMYNTFHSVHAVHKHKVLGFWLMMIDF